MEGCEFSSRDQWLQEPAELSQETEFGCGIGYRDWASESLRHGSSGVGSAASALLTLTVAFHQQGQHIATHSEN